MIGHVKIYRDEIRGKDWKAYCALPNGKVINHGGEDEYIVFITAPEDTALNDNVIYNMMITDLQKVGASEAEAREWAEDEGEGLITEMWDAYTQAIENYNV